MEEKELIANMIQTPDGTILRSLYRHDYVRYTDTVSGEDYFTDGGTDYQRISVNKVPAKVISIYSDAPFEQIREYLVRGTFEECAECKRIWVKLNCLSDEHITNIIDYNNQLFGAEGLVLNTKVNKYYIMEQVFRKEHGIVIPEHEYQDNEIVRSITKV